jgi:hypothetical protein
MDIGNRVKVVEQDITGTIIRHDWGNKVVITDDDSEDEYPENTLTYFKDELILIEEEVA